mmetsp:Transcript_107797/g.310461  ORF Transcript_107797/g.310461 Transcript_107797/m.310461 type:complete len:292 (+) Transcript_107797:154-1029(+)
MRRAACEELVVADVAELRDVGRRGCAVRASAARRGRGHRATSLCHGGGLLALVGRKNGHVLGEVDLVGLAGLQVHDLSDVARRLNHERTAPHTVVEQDVDPLPDRRRLVEAFGKGHFVVAVDVGLLVLAVLKRLVVLVLLCLALVGFGSLLALLIAGMGRRRCGPLDLVAAAAAEEDSAALQKDASELSVSTSALEVFPVHQPSEVFEVDADGRVEPELVAQVLVLLLPTPQALFETACTSEPVHVAATKDAGAVHVQAREKGLDEGPPGCRLHLFPPPREAPIAALRRSL